MKLFETHAQAKAFHKAFMEAWWRIPVYDLPYATPHLTALARALGMLK